jgi:hypothetical protein
MAETAPMTIRLDPQLKAHAEKVAAASGMTLTDFVVRALKGAATPVCATCGRSSLSPTLPPGFTPAFDDFYRKLCSPSGAINTPFDLFTLEGGVQKVYWCRLRSIDALPEYAGVVAFDALLDWKRVSADWSVPSDEVYPMAVPRGVIQGWRLDQDGRHYAAHVALGYVDGNEPGRREYYARRARGL